MTTTSSFMSTVRGFEVSRVAAVMVAESPIGRLQFLRFTVRTVQIVGRPVLSNSALPCRRASGRAAWPGSQGAAAAPGTIGLSYRNPARMLPDQTFGDGPVEWLQAIAMTRRNGCAANRRSWRTPRQV